MKNKTKLVFGLWILVFGSLNVFAQEPKPGAAKAIIVPAVKEKKCSARHHSITDKIGCKFRRFSQSRFGGFDCNAFDERHENALGETNR